MIVRDNGPGIPPVFYDRVFQRFFRLEQSRTTPGSGLGLSLVAAVASLHDFEIALSDNQPGLIVTLVAEVKQNRVASDQNIANNQ